MLQQGVRGLAQVLAQYWVVQNLLCFIAVAQCRGVAQFCGTCSPQPGEGVPQPGVADLSGVQVVYRGVGAAAGGVQCLQHEGSGVGHGRVYNT